MDPVRVIVVGGIDRWPMVVEVPDPRELDPEESLGFVAYEVRNGNVRDQLDWYCTSCAFRTTEAAQAEMDRLMRERVAALEAELAELKAREWKAPAIPPIDG